MKTSTLSALLVALLATPQASLGRSIPHGVRSDEPNGPDVGMSCLLDFLPSLLFTIRDH